MAGTSSGLRVQQLGTSVLWYYCGEGVNVASVVC